MTRCLTNWCVVQWVSLIPIHLVVYSIDSQRIWMKVGCDNWLEIVILMSQFLLILSSLSIYSVSPSPGSDLKHAGTACNCVHTLFVFVCVRGRCSFFQLLFANKCATSLPGDGVTVYNKDVHRPHIYYMYISDNDRKYLIYFCQSMKPLNFWRNTFKVSTWDIAIAAVNCNLPLISHWAGMGNDLALLFSWLGWHHTRRWLLWACVVLVNRLGSYAQRTLQRGQVAWMSDCENAHIHILI